MLSCSPPLSDLIIRELAPGVDAVGDASLMTASGKSLTTYDHGCCTARIGGNDDPQAVTDWSGRVRQVEGLRVVDASIFSDTVSVPLRSAALMLAERVAAGLLEVVPSSMVVATA